MSTLLDTAQELLTSGLPEMPQPAMELEMTIKTGDHLSLRERFDMKAAQGPGCMLWMASQNGNGYGQIKIGDVRPHGAHRVAWELYRGPIPIGLTIDHLCRNSRCVNVEHMEVVTMKENLLRAKAHRGNINKLVPMTFKLSPRLKRDVILCARHVKVTPSAWVANAVYRILRGY